MPAYVAILPSRSKTTSPSTETNAVAALAHAQRRTALTPPSSRRQSSFVSTAEIAPRTTAGAKKLVRCQKAADGCKGANFIIR